MARKLRPALNIVSDIGCLGFDLQHHSEKDISEAVAFMRLSNQEMFDWIARHISGQGETAPAQELSKTPDQLAHWLKTLAFEIELNRASAVPEQLRAIAGHIYPHGIAAIGYEVRSPQDAPQAPQWQAMDTAPRDGTHVLVIEPKNLGQIRIASYERMAYSTGSQWFSSPGRIQVRPIGWMPLPTAPVPPPPTKETT